MKIKCDRKFEKKAPCVYCYDYYNCKSREEHRQRTDGMIGVLPKIKNRDRDRRLHGELWNAWNAIPKPVKDVTEQVRKEKENGSI